MQHVKDILIGYLKKLFRRGSPLHHVHQVHEVDQAGPVVPASDAPEGARCWGCGVRSRLPFRTGPAICLACGHLCFRCDDGLLRPLTGPERVALEASGQAAKMRLGRRRVASKLLEANFANH